MLKKILLACRIIKYYCQGFVAAMCVIQMGDVPAHRESKSNGRHFLNTPLRYLMLPAYLYKNMIRFTPHKIQRNPALIAYCGHSKNNINQFENFHKWNESVLSEYDRPAYDNNIANAEVGFGMVRFRHVVVPNIVFAVLTFFLFLFTRIKLNKTTFEYGIKYYRSFIRHLFYCFENIDFLPQMVVFSNDHNPFYLGVSRCFKVFGVNRVYLQHGGVSNIFPKLDFEAAVLFDQKSKDIYSKHFRSIYENFQIG